MPPPLVVHVVYRFDVGGLENGVVNLINRMPPEGYRHAVVALSAVEPSFAARVQRQDTEFVALNKRPGHGFWLYPRLWRLLRGMKPSIVHTRNLAALEAQVPAFAAGVAARIHGEHGRDVEDIDGTSIRHQRIRRLYRPVVTEYVALSRDLSSYLTQRIGVAENRVAQIYNGVDTERFVRTEASRAPIPGCPFVDTDLWIVGTVGRMQTVKDQTTLANAFVHAVQSQPTLRTRMRLVMVGSGPLRERVATILEDAALRELAWLPGEREDIPAILRGLDCFAMPSLAEGISNTILEAMATSLPVVATAVGGNSELVENGRTGLLVPPCDPAAMAEALMSLFNQRSVGVEMGRQGRASVLARFSLETMVESYRALYDGALQRHRGR